MMSLEEFYAGRSVLVTGATGFVGKVLIEKLLRSCPRLRRVFILVRAKRGQTVQQRVETLLNNQVAV
jgi:fatty acyl-CoA reductase